MKATYATLRQPLQQLLLRLPLLRFLKWKVIFLNRAILAFILNLGENASDPIVTTFIKLFGFVGSAVRCLRI